MREVLGDEYFERREATTSAFNMPVRTFSEEACFGDVWTRPGLERSTRSLILIGLMTAMGKATELRAHVRSAINNGCTVEQIQEVLYQCTVYCGLPAGIEGFRTAEETLRELKKID